MRSCAHVTGWLALVGAAGLVLLGLLSWPPGGMMFALPFIFIIPGIFLAIVGGVLVWVGRRPPVDPPHQRAGSILP